MYIVDCIVIVYICGLYSEFDVWQVHTFVRDADDSIEWIQEKDNWVSSDDYGHDLDSVRALIAKHEGFEQDLAAISNQVRSANHQVELLPFFGLVLGTSDLSIKPPFIHPFSAMVYTNCC